MLKKIKPYFLVWLLFPAVWFYFYVQDNPEPSTISDTLFYTSLKAPKGSEVDLFNGKTFMVGMHTTGAAFNKLEYQGKIKHVDSLNIKISGVSTKDTVLFLSVNLFKDNSVSTLPANQFQFLKPDSATLCANTRNILSYSPAQNTHTIAIHLNNPANWSTPNISHFKFWILITAFLITLIAIILLQPSFKYLTIVTILTTLILSFYWWIGKDIGSLLSIKNDTPLKEVVFYHNSIPVFLPNPHEFFKGPDKAFRTVSDLINQPYYRLSINRENQSIKNLSFNFSFGLISKSWNLNSINPSEIFANDIDYNYSTSEWKISGTDPYFSFITSDFISSNQKLLFLRKSFFLFISGLIFIVFLLLQPVLADIPLPKIILVSLFFAIIFNTLAFWLFNSRKLVLDAEKRLAFDSPSFDTLSMKEFGRRFGIYIQDQMPGRNNLITSNNYFKYELFGEVPGNPMVYFGKDNWMFYTGENVREIYENKHPLTDNELNKMKDVLVGRRDWLRKRNIRYYIFFPRIPHYIYNEKIGSGLNMYNPKPKLIVLLEYLKKNTDLDIIDVETPILEAKSKYHKNLYYPNDSHWTLFGAYFAYREIINHIKKDFPNMPAPISFDDITWLEADDNDADLAQLLDLNTVIKRHEYIPINHRVNAFNLLPTPNYPEFQSIRPMLFFSSNNTTAPKLLMNRDSYTNFLMPFFATNFSRQAYLWSPFFYPSIVEKEKPDIVITEMLERFIYDLLKDTSTPGDSLQAGFYQGHAD